MVFKIADLYIDIEGSCEYIYKFCMRFRCVDYPKIDFSVRVNHEEIIAELDKNTVPENASYREMVFAELNAIYRKICAEILKYDGFMMHGALISYENKGYLFTAKSGVGKTTHVNLWRKVFGEDKVVIVNGDKPILRFVDGKLYAYGTPWCGKEFITVNTRVELAAIGFLNRAEDNSIKEIFDDEALFLILSQIMLADSADLGKQLELVDKLLANVRTFSLKCNMEPEAAEVVYKGMNS